MACAEESLRNLGLDTIDLLQLHVWKPEWIAPTLAARVRGVEALGQGAAPSGISLTEHDPDSGARA